MKKKKTKDCEGSYGFIFSKKFPEFTRSRGGKRLWKSPHNNSKNVSQCVSIKFSSCSHQVPHAFSTCSNLVLNMLPNMFLVSITILSHIVCPKLNSLINLHRWVKGKNFFNNSIEGVYNSMWVGVQSFRIFFFQCVNWIDSLQKNPKTNQNKLELQDAPDNQLIDSTMGTLLKSTSI